MKSDAELVAEVLCGEMGSFEVLVQRYQRAVMGTALAVLGDFHAAQDAAQDAFIVAYRKLGTLRSGASFAPWILRLARRRAVELSRQQAKRRQVTIPPDLANVSSDGQLDDAARVASTSGGQRTYQYGEENAEMPAAQTHEGEEDPGLTAGESFEYGRGEGREIGIRSAAINAGRAETVPLLPDWALRGADHAGRPLPSMQVARSSAIARCKIVEILEESDEDWGLCKCKVERVIYGKLPGKQIGAYTHTRGRLGTTRVFYLQAIPPEANAETKYFVSGGGPVDVDEMHEFEREVVEIVERGDHLTPPDLAYYPSQYILASTRIVRAKLRKVGKGAAEWSVLDELEFQPLSEAEAKGIDAVATASQGAHDSEQHIVTGRRPTEPGIVRVGLGTWRLRAETVARFHAYRDAKRACTEEEIQKQFDRLATAELKAGTEAILLLRAPKGADTYNLVGNFFPDPEDPGRLDKAWKALTKTIESGEYRTPQSFR